VLECSTGRYGETRSCCRNSSTVDEGREPSFRLPAAQPQQQATIASSTHPTHQIPEIRRSIIL
jgi:hypothetical protein